MNFILFSGYELDNIKTRINSYTYTVYIYYLPYICTYIYIILLNQDDIS